MTQVDPDWLRGPTRFFVIKYVVQEGNEEVEVGPTLVNTDDYLIFRDVLATCRAVCIEVSYQVLEAYPIGTSELEAVMRFSRDYRQRGTIFDIRRRAIAAKARATAAD